MFSRQLLNVSSRVSSKSNLTVQTITCHRSFHAACKYLRRDLIVHIGKTHQNKAPVISATFVRFINVSTPEEKGAASTSTSSNSKVSAESTPNAQITDNSLQADEVISQIPEPPAPFVQEITEAIVSEPTLQDLGLGSNWPPGLIQQLLDYIHVSLDIPWWGAIALTTVCFRMLMLPIVIRIQRYSARMFNVNPQIQYIHEQMADARKMQDHMEVIRLTHELNQFMKDKNVNPLTNAWLPLIQGPIFISFFWALRGMVQLPVESMKQGGLWWFTDLTVPDPYYLLPILTSVTLFATLELGADTVKASAMGNMKHILRMVPIGMFPFIINFEGGILCYWVSTNLFSLIQVSILRMPKVREFCKIPAMVKHEKTMFERPKKNFVDGFKDSWNNMKVARDLQSRHMYDEIVFEKAGKGPVPKTYKFDPTKVNTTVQPRNAVLSKKRD